MQIILYDHNGDGVVRAEIPDLRPRPRAIQYNGKMYAFRYILDGVVKYIEFMPQDLYILSEEEITHDKS